MASLDTNEKQVLEKLLGMGGGYVLNFSDRGFREFFLDDVGVNIFDEKYNYSSGSKANRLRGFWQTADDALVGKSIDKFVAYINSQIMLGNLNRDQFGPDLVSFARGIAARLQMRIVNADGDPEAMDQQFLKKEREAEHTADEEPSPKQHASQDAKRAAEASSVVGKTWWKDPTVLVALIGLFGVALTGYLQFVYKSGHEGKIVHVGFFVKQAGTAKFLKYARVVLQLSATHVDTQTDGAGLARFDVDPEKEPTLKVTVSAAGYQDGSFTTETPKGNQDYDIYLDPSSASQTFQQGDQPEIDADGQSVAALRATVLFTYSNVTADGAKCSNGRIEKRGTEGAWVELIPSGANCKPWPVSYEELGQDDDWFYAWDNSRHMTARFPKKSGEVNWVLGKVYPYEAASKQWNVSQEVTRIN